MKKVLVGTALTLFALAPAMGWADCSDGHGKASMASSTRTPSASSISRSPGTSWGASSFPTLVPGSKLARASCTSA